MEKNVCICSFYTCPKCQKKTHKVEFVYAKSTNLYVVSACLKCFAMYVVRFLSDTERLKKWMN